MNEKLGLALASGGARGAYQAGALLALAEHGLCFSSIAGTSIGSLNGAFYCTGDGSPGHMENLCRLWRAAPDAGLISVDSTQVGITLFKLFGRTALPEIFKFSDMVIGQDQHLLDPRPVEAFLDQWIDYSQVIASEKTLFIAMMPATSVGEITDPIRDIVEAPWRKTVYFRASTLRQDELKRALLASSAIPLFFPSRKVHGKRYTDAGLTMPLPSKVLRDAGCACICSIFLSDTHTQNRTDYPDATLLQIRPTSNIDSSILTMLDFKRDHIEQLINLGYKDANTTLAEAQQFNDLIQRLSDSTQHLESLTESLNVAPKLKPW